MKKGIKDNETRALEETVSEILKSRTESNPKELPKGKGKTKTPPALMIFKEKYCLFEDITDEQAGQIE